MARTYHDAPITAAQMDKVLASLNSVSKASNNGKILCVDDFGFLTAKTQQELHIGAVLEPVTINENGTVTPPEGVDGFDSVTVDVQGSAPVLQNKIVTQNGVVTPDTGYDGLGQVTVDVPGGGYPEPTGTIQIAANGTVNVKDYASAEVNVPSGGYPEPTGTIQIAANGTANVKDYASANVNVPNSYSAADEGKVVKNGALVAQTARATAITANGTYNTTENNSVTVNVSGGGASISTDFGGFNELIPVMTSDTAPSGTASASSALNSSFAAYRAFDGVNTQWEMRGGWLAAANDQAPWIQYVFDSLKNFSFLRIRTANNSTTATRSVTVEGLTASDVWENCLANGNSVSLEFRQNTYGNSCLDYQIALNGQQYKGLRISGNEAFYGGMNQYACTFDSIQIYEVAGQFPGIGYYRLTIPLDSFGGDGNLYTNLFSGITYQKQNGSWSEI